MKWALLGLALLPALFLIGVESDEPPRQDTVDELDVDKYLGKWYAVAGIPQFLTKTGTVSILVHPTVRPFIIPLTPYSSWKRFRSNQ